MRKNSQRINLLQKAKQLRLLCLVLLMVMAPFSIALPYGRASQEQTVSAITPQVISESGEAFNTINTAWIEKGKVVRCTNVSIPDSAFSIEPFEQKQLTANIVVQPSEKIHPKLNERLRTAVGNETERVVINFRDDVKIPQFPQLDPGEPRESPLNKIVLERIRQIVEAWS